MEVASNVDVALGVVVWFWEESGGVVDVKVDVTVTMGDFDSFGEMVPIVCVEA